MSAAPDIRRSPRWLREPSRYAIGVNIPGEVADLAFGSGVGQSYHRRDHPLWPPALSQFQASDGPPLPFEMVREPVADMNLDRSVRPVRTPAVR
jgi:hypothetical protein